MNTSLRYGIAQEAARIICEELVTDYRQAKLKAATRLGLSPKTAMPDNQQVQQAVIEYQRLFGGADYASRLRQMRQTAVRAMRLLDQFSPRLVGGALSGAVTRAHRVQLHVFSDQPELVDVFLHDRAITYDQGERSYRFPDGREERIPLACFEADGVGIDAAVFPEGEQVRAPLNPADGAPFKRLDLAAAEKLLATPVEQLGARPP